MTREDKDSLVEMLAKIPVTETKGSLLSAIGRLLRVIDVSENSIMIPTLLKDKCEFDAYEMLTLAKILKASILGHNDLVEFYLSESSSQFPNESLAHHHHQQQQQQQQQQHQHQLMLSNQPHTTIQQSSINNNNNNNNNNHVLMGGGGGGGGGGRSHRYYNSNTSSSSGHYSQSHSPNNHMVSSSLSHHLTNPIHQLSATPSLRSSVSDSASSSTPSTPLPNLAESIGSSSGGGSGSNGASGRGAGSGNSGNCNNDRLSKNQLQRLQLGSNGDPDATVSLLLQIEHLKVFIPHVTSIFESIVELYKNSVDTFGR